METTDLDSLIGRTIRRAGHFRQPVQLEDLQDKLEADEALEELRAVLVIAAEIDLGPGAAFLSPELASSLTEAEEPVPAEETEPTPEPATVPSPDAAEPAAVALTIEATEDDLHTTNTALAGLRRITTPGTMRIGIEVEVRSDYGPLDKVAFQNKVRQHLREDPEELPGGLGGRVVSDVIETMAST